MVVLQNVWGLYLPTLRFSPTYAADAPSFSVEACSGRPDENRTVNRHGRHVSAHAHAAGHVVPWPVVHARGGDGCGADILHVARGSECGGLSTGLAAGGRSSCNFADKFSLAGIRRAAAKSACPGRV